MQVQLEKIPQFLKMHGQFCNWKYELRDGNQTKVPYTPGTTRRASVSDPAAFTAFDTAVSATGYDGIGIRVRGRIVGIDLDHCIAQVKKHTEVKELDAEIIRALVERIDVFTPEKVPGTRTKKQTILIHWNFIGAVELPQEQNKSA